MQDNLESRVKEANNLNAPDIKSHQDSGHQGLMLIEDRVLSCHHVEEAKIEMEDFSPRQEEATKRHKLHLCSH